MKPKELRMNALVHRIADDQHISPEEARPMVDMVLDGISSLLLDELETECGKGGVVLNLLNFGKFRALPTPGGRRRDPRTGQTLTVRVRPRISFKPATAFRNAVRGIECD